MKKTGLIMLVLVVSLSMAGVVMAADNPPFLNGGTSAAKVAPMAAGPYPLAKTNAKLAALITPNDGVIRAKGVADVTHPDVGIYCIKPSARLDVTTIIPIVTVEWGYSSGDSLLAFYYDWYQFGSGECPDGYLEVQTYNFGGGAPVLANTVAFFIQVH